MSAKDKQQLPRNSALPSVQLRSPIFLPADQRRRQGVQRIVRPRVRDFAENIPGTHQQREQCLLSDTATRDHILHHSAVHVQWLAAHVGIVEDRRFVQVLHPDEASVKRVSTSAEI